MKVKKTLLMILAVFAAVLCFAVVSPTEASAASWKQINFYSRGWEKELSYIKVGNYYFKSNSSYKLAYSKKKSSGYKSLDIYASVGAWCNGKTLYYSTDNVLYKITLSSGKKTKVKDFSSLKAYDEDYVSLSMVYGKYIYLTVGSFDGWSFTTYRYNTSTKKTTKTKSNCAIVRQIGQYCVGQNEYRTDVSPYKTTLYKITSSGALKKVKVLGQRTFGVYVVGSKFYYTTYNKTVDKMTLYRCSKSGGSRKKLFSVTASGSYSMPYITYVTSKYCLYRASMGASTSTKKTY